MLTLRNASRGELTAAAILSALLVLSIAVSCVAPGLQRPLTTKEKIYQAGGILLGLGQELEFALRSGVVKGETANVLVQAYDAANQLYRAAAGYAIAANEAEASRAYTELLRTVDALRRQLLTAGVKT